MPQIFQVLRCFKCLVFQVHQSKKSNKFACKMCGEKQTIKRNYGLGNGQECRVHVQKLNGIRGEIDELNKITSSDSDSDEETEPTQKPYIKINKFKGKSKWSNYVDKEKDETKPNPEEPMFLGQTEVVLEVPAKRKKFVKPKASNTQLKNIPWNKTPVMKNDIIPFTDNFFSGSKDLEIIEVNVENKPDKVDNPLINKIVIKENVNLSAVNNQSKWAQFKECEDNENQFLNSGLQNIDNTNNVKSNWEQSTKENKTFSDNKALNQFKVKEDSQNNETKVPISIFSMCDEIDLDSILDI